MPQRFTTARSLCAIVISVLIESCSGGAGAIAPQPPQSAGLSGTSQSVSPLIEMKKRQVRYELVDLGTFGGPASYYPGGANIFSERGSVAGSAETTAPDPFAPNCFDANCLVSHTFTWRRGVIRDLGALPGGALSQAVWMSESGRVLGNSQDGKRDPETPGGPAMRSVLYDDGRITDLGALPGGYSSLSGAVNERGQAVGLSFNAIRDPFSLFAPGFTTTQTRAFLWHHGVMRDIGTLGGPDAFAVFINERGDIAGISYPNSSPNTDNGAACNPNAPATDTFFRDEGKMIDIGTLGGTCNLPTWLNDRGEIIGNSYLSGNRITHAFLWNGHMSDLGTLGGSTSFANFIDRDGEIVGKSDVPGASPQNHDAVLWKHGVISDLGKLTGDSCSNAYWVNSHDQVVGTSENRALCLIPTGQHAFLWDRGGPMLDLNDLIPAGSPLELTFAYAINDRGEIAGVGVPPGCDAQNYDVCGHAFVLIPCAERSDREACEHETSMLTRQNVAVPFVRPQRFGRRIYTDGPLSVIDRFRVRFAHP